MSQTEQINICQKTLTHALSKMLGTSIVHADYQTKQLQGGTVGDVQLITGIAGSSGGDKLPFKVVLKVQQKWERYNDPDSWRREYDLYQSNLETFFEDSLRWPKCYHAEMAGDETRLWLEYIEGTSGLDMTGEMYERAAKELGRFQGKLYTQQLIKGIANLSEPDAMEKFYRHYKSWDVVYDYIRSDKCEIPKHLCKMITDADENADVIFNLVSSLPIVLCHRDFWITNIFYCDGDILLLDWDTTGWGYMGEDITSLIADEADVDNMVEYYHKCIAAYCQGFSEYADISHISDLYIRERIILHFGYRLIEWYLDAETPEGKQLHLSTLQKIYEMGA